MSSLQNMTPAERQEMARRAAATKRAKSVKVNPDSVTFGVEIECYLPNQNYHDLGINVGSYHNGLPLPYPFPSGWNAQKDASLRWLDEDARRLTYTGLEIVSPPLSGLAGLDEVKAVMDILESNNALTTEKCGIHVHVGMGSILGERSGDFEIISEWVRRLLHLTAKHETALLALTGTKTRINNHYAGTVKEVWRDKVQGRVTMRTIEASYPRGWAATAEERQTRDRIWDLHRYRVLNLSNLFTEHKTVEFRAFAGTNNGIKVVGYILVALGLAIKAAENTSAAAWDMEPTEFVADAKYYQDKVKHLHDRLAWMDAASRVKCGFPSGAWAKYGAVVKKNQLWNAEFLAKKIKAAQAIV